MTAGCPARSFRGRRCALLTCATLAVCAQARAELPGLAPTYNPDDPYQVPDAPAPPTLPDLTHRAWAVSLELTFARVTPPRRDDGARPEGVGVGMARLEGEAAVSNRRWYIGCAQVIAEGRSLSGDRADTLIGNPELWGRALWASREGLAFGGGLGFVPPLVGEPPERGASVAGTVRVVRPWDYPHFAGQVVVLRPFLDVRAMDGPIMLQLRQGIDMLGNATDRVAIPDTNLTSRTTLYLGYRPVEPLGIGLELWEVYFIKASGVADDERAVFALSPSVRWMTQVLQPALSMIFPIDRPLFHEAKDYWAIRLHIGAILDPSPPASDW